MGVGIPGGSLAIQFHRCDSMYFVNFLTQRQWVLTRRLDALML